MLGAFFSTSGLWIWVQAIWSKLRCKGGYGKFTTTGLLFFGAIYLVDSAVRVKSE